MAYILQDDDEDQQNTSQQNALASAASNAIPAPISGGGSATASNAAATPTSNSSEASSTNPADSGVAPATSELQSDTTTVSGGNSSGANAGGETTPTSAAPNASGSVTGGGTATQQAAPAVATYGRINSLNSDQATQLANSVANNSLTTQNQGLNTAADQANSTFQSEISPDTYNLDSGTEGFINNALAAPQSLDSGDTTQFQSYLNGYQGPTSLSTNDLAPVTTAQTEGDQYFNNLSTDSGAQAALQSLYQNTMNGQTPTQGESAFDAMLLQNNSAVQPIFNTAENTYNTNATNAQNNLATQAASEVGNAQTQDQAVQDYINSQYGTANQNFENTVNSAVTTDQQNYAAQQAALNSYLTGLTPGASAPAASTADLSALGLTQAQLDSLVSAEQSGTQINPLTYLNTTAPTYNPNTVATADQVAYYNALQSLMGQPNSYLNEPGTPGGSQTFDYNNALAAANIKPTVNPTVNGNGTGTTGTPAAATSPAVVAGGIGGAIGGAAQLANLAGKVGNLLGNGASAGNVLDEVTPTAGADLGAATGADLADDGTAAAGGDVLDEVTPTAGTDLGDATGADLAGSSGTSGLAGTLASGAAVVGAAYSIYNAVTNYTSGATGQDTINGAEAGASTGAAVGSIVPGIGTAIGAVVGAVVGALSGAISSAFGGGAPDPETTSMYSANAAGPNVMAGANGENSFSYLTGIMDGKGSSPAGSLEGVFGRMGESNLLNQMATQINSAVASGKIPAGSSASDVFTSVIQPWLAQVAPKGVGAGSLTFTDAKGNSSGNNLQDALTNLVNSYMSGALTTSTALDAGGQTDTTLPAYKGSPPAASTQPTVQAVQKAAPVAAPTAALPLTKAQQLALLQATANSGQGRAL